MSCPSNETLGTAAGLSNHSRAGGLHLAVDAHRLVCEPLTSGATYLRTLLSEWNKLENKPNVDLLLPGQPGLEFTRQAPFSNPQIRCLYPSSPVNPIARYLAQLAWQQWTIPSLLRRNLPQVYFSPFHLTPQLPSSVKMVTTIHDLCWLFEPRFSLGTMIHRAQLASACLRASRLICVSQFTLDLLARWSPRFARKARVVHNGLENPVVDRQIALERVRALDAKLIPNEYLLWIGSPTPRKNLSLLFAIFKVHHERFPSHKFVVVAPADAHPKLLASAKDHNLEPALRLMKSVDDLTRDSLYRCAWALIFPSVCEGFGYPLLEAMLQGCPPFAFQHGPAREMVSGIVPLATALTTQAFIQAMDKYQAYAPADQERLRSELIGRAARFSAKHMAIKTLEILQETGESMLQPGINAR